MAKDEPSISANKLGEYMTALAPRRRRILIQQKYPPEYITTRYREAQELIQQFSANPSLGTAWLKAKAAEIKTRPATKEHARRNLALNADALILFADFIDSLNDKKYGALTFKIGSHRTTHLLIAGTRVSVRPELIAEWDLPKGAGKVVGGVKLHFPKTSPLSNDAGAYVGTLLTDYATEHLTGTADYRACAVVDVPQKKLHWAPKLTKRRTEALQDACAEIAGVWSTLPKPTGYDDGDYE